MSATRPAAAKWCTTSRATVKAGWQRRHHQRGAAVDGEDGGQSRRATQERVRRISGSARGQPISVLLRRAGWTVLRVQPTRREALSGRDLALVAPVHDGWRQG